VRVIVLGEDTPGALLHSYLRGFSALGVSATGYCQKRAYERSMPMARTRVGRRVLHRVTARRFNERLLNDLGGERADLILLLKGQHVMPQTVERLRTIAPVFNFYPDDPFSGHFSARLTYGTASLVAYDVCLTFAHHLIPVYRRVGVRAAAYLPFAADPGLHRPPARSGMVDFDVVFVGNLDAPERVHWLTAVADYRLGIFGEKTRREVPRRSPLRRATFHPPVYGADLAEALSRGAISINILRDQNRLSHNMRSYESPACGAFTLSQRSPELTKLFREGEEVVFFETIEELREQVAYWLARDADRMRIARAGLERARRETYAERARTVLELAARA
jgi:spore maturation protein CgeB